MIQAYRGGRYVKVAGEGVSPERLSNVLSQREFEALPEASILIRDIKSTAKYRSWDVAEKIDATKGIRRKQLKITMELIDGKRKRVITFYHRIKRNTKSSYRLFQRINEEIGFEGMFLYKSAGGKLISDRRGRKVTLGNVRVEEVV